MRQYSHTQRGKLHWLTNAVALSMLLVVFWLPWEKLVLSIFVATALLCVATGFCFQSLTVTDCGDELLVEFGPLTLFRTSIRYDDIATATIGRTSLVDGLGMHFVPGRGWTFNINGRDCVELVKVNGSVVRVGTDEPDKLFAVVRERITFAGRPG